jgi:predicted nucleic acid-binding protein
LTLFYADSSALVKLIRSEPETVALRAFLAGSDLVSCDLVLAELPRAVRRASVHDRRMPVEALIENADQLLDAIALRSLDRALLLAAGALGEPGLRALDAIHVVAALDVFPHDGFVSYDERQSAAARLAGLPTFAPGGSIVGGCAQSLY